MSATNRGAVRNKYDYYVTPEWCVENFLNAFVQDLYHIPWIFPFAKILDPCAGGDEFNEMTYPIVLSRFSVFSKFFANATITTADIREDSKARIITDYLNPHGHSFKGHHNMIITNPPYNLAQEFITKALDDVMDDGVVIMLLRLNFFGSQSRKAFFKNNMPALTYVTAKRPSFTKGGTDASEYMHCVWRKGSKQDFTRLRII